MQNLRSDITEVFKFEKRLQISSAIYLSILLLFIIFILTSIEMTVEVQQALVVILGLISITTIDAFKQALTNKPLPLTSVGNQIIIRDGGVYVGGDYVGGDINHATESRQTLAEAAVEIHKLLQELEKFNPTATTAEKIAYVNEETSSDFKSRVVSAAKFTGEVEASAEIQQALQTLEELEEDLTQNEIRKLQPTLKSRIVNAMKAGGVAAMESVLDNAVSGVAVAIIDGWISAEAGQSSEQHNNPGAAD